MTGSASVRTRGSGRLTRRAVIVTGAVSLASPVMPGPIGSGQARADEPTWRHALALLGTPKYPQGFSHFDYVRPDAPKGGRVRLAEQATFDNFNMFVAGLKGDLDLGAPLLHDTLLVPAQDEVATEYGLIAEAVAYPDDRTSVTYRLRPEARFQDGAPIRPADVVFSFETLKSSSPMYGFYYQTVIGAEPSGDREVTFRFSQGGNRELPQILGEFPIAPRHWWSAVAANGRTRNPAETTLEPPLGSGPYRVKAFEAGRYTLYERVPDYWARDLNVNRGRNNFDEIRFEYYRDASVLLEAFKGDRFDYRAETSARAWATGYDFPAVRTGRVIKEEVPERATGIMQALAFNLRRPALSDPRVRRAFNLALDFEDMNRTLFYGLYRRIDSYFFGTELAASGLPSAAELRVLETVRDTIPPGVTTAAYANPVNGSAEAVRGNLRLAVELLREAGWIQQGRRLANAKTNEPLRVEYLGFDANEERFLLPYRQALERIGIGVDIRIVDAAQYQSRLRSFDFDLTSTNWLQSLSPGNEQREFWGSAAADRPGSRNVCGIKDPGVDALIDRLVYAETREDLVATTRALDRVLLAHDFVVPQWTARAAFTARWNRFGRPSGLPEYGGSAFPSVWWYDDGLARTTGAPP